MDTFDPYVMASNLMGGAAATLGGAADVASGALGTGTDLGAAAAGMLPNSPGTYGPADLNAAMYGNMEAYLDPYYKEVLGAALGDMRDVRDESLSAVGADAATSGAYGGSRHGLVERGIHEDYIQNAGSLAANLKSQGFNNAMNTAGQVLGMDMNRGQYLTGLQHQLDMATPQVFLQGTGLGTNSALNTATTLGNLSGGAAQLGSQYYGVGNNIADRQNTAGGQQQDLLQAILDSGNQTFQQYLQDPYKAMDLMTALLKSDPRWNNSTSNQTSQYTPGILDYLSLLGQGVATYAGVGGSF